MSCFSPHVLFHVDNQARLSVSCFILSGINDTCFFKSMYNVFTDVSS